MFLRERYIFINRRRPEPRWVRWLVAAIPIVAWGMVGVWLLTRFV